MRFPKTVHLLAISLLSSANFLTSVGYGMEDVYEERTFDSTEIRGLRIRTDSGNIDINESNEEVSRIQFRKISGEGNINVSVREGEISIESTNSPIGGCQVNYRAYVPRGTPIAITTGSSNINIDNMGNTDITAGFLFLRARNLLGSANLQYSSGEADIKYDALPQYPYSSTINSASGITTFHLPTEAMIKLNATKPQLVETDFTNCLRPHFSFLFNSSSGALRIKKNES